MTDLEIYKLADNVLSTITRDLTESVYTSLQGDLSLCWDERPKFNAWAESRALPNEPPIHKICLHYELVRQIYRDAEDYYNFTEDELQQEKFLRFFKNINLTSTSLPLASFSKEDCITNMFLAALTWVYFHELGHLIQEHGYIRSKYGVNSKSDQAIHECDINYSNNLIEKAAALNHTTEIAADFEATNYCIFELFRHFTDESLVTKESKGEEFFDAIYLFVCGLSCIFHRFNDTKSPPSDDKPKGSHPHPIIRMEFSFPNIIETLEILNGTKLIKHFLNRSELVHLYSRASVSSTLFWLSKYGKKSDKLENLMLHGIYNRPLLKSYCSIIINTWDEIEQDIKSIRRFGTPTGLISFTDEFRNQVFKVERI